MQSTQVKYISLLPNPVQKTSDFPSRNLAVNQSACVAGALVHRVTLLNLAVNHCGPWTPCMAETLVHRAGVVNLVNYSNPFPKNALLSHSHLHLQKLKIVSFWKKKRPSGSVRTTKIMLQSAYFIASKLKILPEPLDAIIREFGGGYGGGGGGFGFGSGHGWGGFDGRRRKKVNWGFGVAFFMILGVGLWLILGKRVDFDVFLGVLGLTLFGFSVNVWKRGVLDWALGFCCCAALVGLLLKEDLQKCVRCFGTFKIARRRRKRRLF